MKTGTCGGSVHSLVQRSDLVRDHPLQLRLIGSIRHHIGVKLVLPFAGFVRELVTSERMAAYDFSGSGFSEPFGRTFMSLEFGHYLPTYFEFITEDAGVPARSYNTIAL